MWLSVVLLVVDIFVRMKNFLFPNQNLVPTSSKFALGPGK